MDSCNMPMFFGY